jgi:hypothetical protein
MLDFDQGLKLAPSLTRMAVSKTATTAYGRGGDARLPTFWKDQDVKKVAVLLGAIGLIGMAGSAGAMQYSYSWDLTTATGLGTYVSACGSDTSSNCQLVYGSTQQGSKALTARAYSTGSYNPGNNRSILDDPLVGAEINASSWGIGITGPGDNSGLVDNSVRKDALIFEAPTDNYDWESLTLGMTSSGPGSANSAGAGSAVDVQIYVGGSGTDKNFASLCFSDCSGTSTAITASGSGFADLGTFNSVANTPIDLGSSAVGRYLVVSGALNETNDFFSVAAVGGYTVPSPQTLPLLALGLAGMWYVMRRRVST